MGSIFCKQLILGEGKVCQFFVCVEVKDESTITRIKRMPTKIPLWSEPWLQIAASEGTLIPPPKPPSLSPNYLFVLESFSSQVSSEWLAFIKSGFSLAAARARVPEPEAQIALLLDTNNGSKTQIRATCLLRPTTFMVSPQSLSTKTQIPTKWSLEAFTASPQGRGFGETLLRHVIWELNNRYRYGVTLQFRWELKCNNILARLFLIKKNWYSAVTQIESGWKWRDPEQTKKCGFCPITDAWIAPPSLTEKEEEHGGVLHVTNDENDEGNPWSVIVADSGQSDGWGYVLDYTELKHNSISWKRVADAGGWRELWYSGTNPPPSIDGKWIHTGETIVYGEIGEKIQTNIKSSNGGKFVATYAFAELTA